MFLVLATLASWVGWAIAPSLPQVLALSADDLAALRIPRLFSWPLASAPSLWSVINVFLFYYFGIELERMIGARKMAWLLVGIWGSLTASFVLVSIVSSDGFLAGLRPIEMVILLLWIAEYPTRRFLFNIPAWVFGIVLLGLEVLSMLGARSISGLFSLLLSLFFVAIIARRLGMLSDHNWLPGRRRRPKPAAKPKMSRAETRQRQRQVSVQERIDELLDKISEHGIHSLTNAERRELEKLRESRRQQ